MTFILHPCQFYCVILAGWINRHQQEVIEYLLTENQVLKEKLGKKRIPLNDDQRRRFSKSKTVVRLFSPHAVKVMTESDDDDNEWNDEDQNG